MDLEEFSSVVKTTVKKLQKCRIIDAYLDYESDRFYISDPDSYMVLKEVSRRLFKSALNLR